MENFSCSACGHQLQDLTHLLDCPVTEPLRCAILAILLPSLIQSRPWGVAQLLGLCKVPSRSHPSKGVGYHHHHNAEHPSCNGRYMALTASVVTTDIS